ncbi:Zinc finger C2H2 [Penicillium expansum]|nr:Zinc finger C2H2 [Penicillium expansum]
MPLDLVSPLEATDAESVAATPQFPINIYLTPLHLASASEPGLRMLSSAIESSSLMSDISSCDLFKISLSLLCLSNKECIDFALPLSSLILAEYMDLDSDTETEGSKDENHEVHQYPRVTNAVTGGPVQKILQFSGEEFNKCFVDDMHMTQVLNLESFGITRSSRVNPDIQCPVDTCDKWFTTPTSVRIHLRNVHSLSQKEANTLLPPKSGGSADPQTQTMYTFYTKPRCRI